MVICFCPLNMKPSDDSITTSKSWGWKRKKIQFLLQHVYQCKLYLGECQPSDITRNSTYQHSLIFQSVPHRNWTPHVPIGRHFEIHTQRQALTRDHRKSHGALDKGKAFIIVATRKENTAMECLFSNNVTFLKRNIYDKYRCITHQSTSAAIPKCIAPLGGWWCSAPVARVEPYCR